VGGGCCQLVRGSGDGIRAGVCEPLRLAGLVGVSDDTDTGRVRGFDVCHRSSVGARSTAWIRAALASGSRRCARRSAAAIADRDSPAAALQRAG
jgi:hypothetical protein